MVAKGIKVNIHSPTKMTKLMDTAYLLFLLNIYHVSAASFDSETACTYPAKCIPLGNNNICLGSTVKYTHTSLDLVNSSKTLTDQLERLSIWRTLQSVPRCWDAIHSLLCAVYLPSCKDSQVDVYRRDLCEITKEPCGIVTELLQEEWPQFLQCDQPYFSEDDTCTVKTSRRFALFFF